MGKNSDRTNKLYLPIAVLIASIILGGSYFVSQVIKIRENRRQTEREALIKCGEVAQKNYKYFQEEWNRTHDASGYSHFIEMEAHFNKSLNLCVYHGGIITPSAKYGSYTEEHIFNAYTNEILLTFFAFGDADSWDDRALKRYGSFRDRKRYYFE